MGKDERHGDIVSFDWSKTLDVLTLQMLPKLLLCGIEQFSSYNAPQSHIPTLCLRLDQKSQLKVMSCMQHYDSRVNALAAIASTSCRIANEARLSQ